MKLINVRLHDEEVAKIKAIALEEGTTVTGLIRKRLLGQPKPVAVPDLGDVRVAEQPPKRSRTKNPQGAGHAAVLADKGQDAVFVAPPATRDLTGHKAHEVLSRVNRGRSK